jgi:hypothetical protein
MHQGQLVFAQLMRHLPLTTFRRCVARYSGEHKVKSFSCLDRYLCMAFAQLTFRESLRDIESSLRAQSAKLYHLGIRGTVSRNTLANADATRDWRIYASFAERLLGIARSLYAEEPFGMDLAETVYALDATTIDLCLSVFPWAPFRSTKAAVKLHTLVDLRGNIPSFIHISDGKMHDVNVLDLLLPEPGAYYVMDRGVSRLRTAVSPARSGQLLRHARQIEPEGRAPLFASGGSSERLDLRSNGDLEWLLFAQRVSRPVTAYQVHRSEDPQAPGILDQPIRVARLEHRRSVSMPLAGRTVLQMDQAASAHQGILRDFRKRSEDANLDRHFGLRPRRHRQEAPEPATITL